MQSVSRVVKKLEAIITSFFVISLMLGFLSGAAYSLEPNLNNYPFSITLWSFALFFIFVQLVLFITTKFSGRYARWREETHGSTILYLYKAFVGLFIIALVVTALIIVRTS